MVGESNVSVASGPAADERRLFSAAVGSFLGIVVRNRLFPQF
jgi:hypothetical protein